MSQFLLGQLIGSITLKSNKIYLLQTDTVRPSISDNTLITYTFPFFFANQDSDWKLVNKDKNTVMSSGVTYVPVLPVLQFDVEDFMSDGAELNGYYYYEWSVGRLACRTKIIKLMP